MAAWQEWVGRTEVRSDWVDQAMLLRWAATFDRQVTVDAAAPQGFHWCLGTPVVQTALLGQDGHPHRDGSPDDLLPPAPLPRRMWASSDIDFYAPLKDGRLATRRSRIASVKEKVGGSGRLLFVQVAHETHSQDELVLSELQSIVYREAPSLGAPPAPPILSAEVFDPKAWDFHHVVTPSEALLFRYSALTFNSHRIHYDAPYAREVEGYRGLVVHGPLTATLLLLLAQERLGDNALRRFCFRGLSPAIVGEPLHLVLRGSEMLELGAFASDGRHVMSASATT